MTKCLAIGIPLVDVIKAATWMPAKAIGWEDRIGTLKVGMCADVTCLKLVAEDGMLEDCQSQVGV